VCVFQVSVSKMYISDVNLSDLSLISTFKDEIQVMDTSNHKIGFKISARPKRKRHKPQKKGEYRRF
jgi:hypothetical protein